MTKQTGAVGAHNAKVMNRFELTKRLVGQLKRDEAVVGGIGNANFDLWASGQRPQNFYMLGSMGLAIPIAFGVAIAQPQRHVIALEGDGSLLMSPNVLATAAAARPANLTIVLWVNGHYESSGGQALPAAPVDWAALARASGIASVETVGEPAGLAPALHRARLTDVPAVLVLPIAFDPAERIPPYSERPEEIRARFTL